MSMKVRGSLGLGLGLGLGRELGLELGLELGFGLWNLEETRKQFRVLKNSQNLRILRNI